MLISKRELNRSLRAHDRNLYCEEIKPGRTDIYRKSDYGDAQPHYLFSLTDNWGPNGKPRIYGIDWIMNRIRAMDLWRDDTFVEKWIKEHEKEQESADRDRQNSVESFLYDFRSQFQKAVNGINTSTLNKVYRKEGQDGSFKSR